MNSARFTMISWAVAAVLTGTSALCDEPADTVSSSVNPPHRPARLKIPQHSLPVIPVSEPETFANAGSVSGTTLTGPATLTYSGASNALSVADSGTGRAVSATLSNANSGSSAIYGGATGTGAGVAGYNSGTTGPGGKFAVTNADSAEPGAFATTNGTGPAILATATNKNSNYAAIYGQSFGSIDNQNSTGVEGEGGYIGVYGAGDGYGVYGTGNAAGVYGYSYGTYGVDGSSVEGYAVFGNSTSGYGVYGESDSGYGVYGYSQTGYAGYFNGTVAAYTYDTLSDKNAKSDFKPVDNKDILDKVSRLPITSWDFKTDKKQRRHVGPMAQDFHAEFGLAGDDDKHINLGDMAGVTLAAVQELNERMKQKDAQIAELKSLLAAQSEAFSARIMALEQHSDVKQQTAALQ